MINRRNFLTLIGTEIFVSMFSGCGESSKPDKPAEVATENFNVFDFEISADDMNKIFF